jgi:hypothetical protein
VDGRSDRLLREIESGVLDQGTSIGDLLRKAVALGGRAGSAELRDWATRELQGYGPDDELPEYRKIAAALLVDMIAPGWSVTGRTISPTELPDFAQDVITNDVNLRQGIGQIEQLARRGDAVKIQPGGAPDLVRFMNAQGNLNGHLERLYWSVSPVALDGVVDQVRNTLTVMIAEINANLPDGTDTLPAEVATNAINVAVNGKGHKINLAAPQQGSTVTTTSPEEEPRRWGRTAWGVLLGLVAIIAAVLALMQVQGWQF